MNKSKSGDINTTQLYISIHSRFKQFYGDYLKDRIESELKVGKTICTQSGKKILIHPDDCYSIAEISCIGFKWLRVTLFIHKYNQKPETIPIGDSVILMVNPDGSVRCMNAVPAG